jgi:hypothetical protein
MSTANPNEESPREVEQPVSQRIPTPTPEGEGRVEKARRVATRWIKKIGIRDLVLATVLALLAAYIVAPLFEEARPYRVYVVADHDTNDDTLTKLLQRKDNEVLGTVGDVKVEVKLERLESDDNGMAEQKAQELSQRPDTLMVIQHGRSSHVEGSLPVYFGVRPQIPVITTVASDDNLLVKCGAPCFNVSLVGKISDADPTQFVPLLQLSPTNAIEGRSAVQFATQKKKRNFLVIYGSDPKNQAYTASMVAAYSEAIAGFKAQLVGTKKMDELPTEADFNSWKPDCILYAGGMGEARTLFNRLSAMHLKTQDLMVIFSDSVVESRGEDINLKAFNPPAGAVPTQGKTLPSELKVEFTYQTDAADYNLHMNSYAEDSFVIARQLVDDLNRQGGDLRFRVKSWFHLHNVNDARRNLVRALEQSATMRTWYAGAEGTPYVFEGHKQYRGLFHVWQLQPNAEMEDVDNWHPPRVVEMTEPRTGAAQVGTPKQVAARN